MWEIIIIYFVHVFTILARFCRSRCLKMLKNIEVLACFVIFQLTVDMPASIMTTEEDKVL